MSLTIVPHENGLLFTLSPEPLPQKLADYIRDRWDTGEEDEDGVNTVEFMLEKAAKIATPHGFLRSAVVDRNDGNTVEIAGYTFTSPLVAEKLTEGATIVGYVITCGRALFNCRAEFDGDFFKEAIWEDISVSYMRLMADALHRYVEKQYFPAQNGKRQFSALNPGSLNSWPITGQKELFAFLESGPDAAGVELTPGMLMLPYKSGSGVYFPTTEPYENCMFCPRIDCPNRRAEFKGDGNGSAEM